MPVLSGRGNTAVGLAEPLPTTNSFLAQAGVVHRRGQFSIVASAPGVGKSLWAANYALRTKVPTLYFSADSDEWTVMQRVCSILSGLVLTEVEDKLEDDHWNGWLTNQLFAVDHIDWCFRPDIDVEFIARRVLTYVEIYGRYPELIVVDNLGNTVEDQENENAELRNICRELHRMARNTSAHIMGLHHVVGPKEDGYTPINQADLKGKLAKDPEQVFGLCKSQDDKFLRVNIAKNRGGKPGQELWVPVSYETATIGGYPSNA